MQLAFFFLFISQKTLMQDARFPQQDAPAKNTDKAFVKVSRDGKPLPDPKGPKQNEPKTKDKEVKPKSER